MPTTPKVTIESDYDGYFEALVLKLLDKEEYKHTEIVISAGPYRAAAVSVRENKEQGIIYLDFYSALRNGFGFLSRQDLIDIKGLL